MIAFFVDSLSNAIGELLADQFGETLNTWSERRALSRSIDAAVLKAERQFVANYSPHDPDLVAALTRDTRFADLPSVRIALRAMLTQPFHDPSSAVEALRQSFADVLPEAVDRERVDALVRAFLSELGQEVLYIPQLRELYALSFQKLSAESGRATAANTAAAANHLATVAAGIRAMQDQLQQIAATPEPRLLAPPTPTPPARPRPWHNLPQRTYSEFIGRREELAQLTRLLLPHPRSRHFVVTIDGIGGVGKSALALELAYGYRDHATALPEAERFDAIVWVSAKRTLLTAGGIQQRRQTFTTLDDLFRELATVLEQPAILQVAAAERRGLIERSLAAQRTLLIIDNLETVDDEELLSFLRELPDPTKAIITTRHRIDIAYAIRLTGMPRADALKLMAVEAQAKGVSLTPVEMDDLERRTGGVPLAIQWSIGLMSLGHSVEGVLRRLGSGQSDIARFCFAESVASIRGRDAYRLLLALALFERSVSRAMLGEVAGLENDIIGRDDGLVELLRLSLINQKQDRFSLLPLTHAFARDELAQHPELERELRERWVAHVTHLAVPYGGFHWRWRDRALLQAEGEHVVSLATWALDQEQPDVLLPLMPALCYYFDLTGDWAEMLRIGEVAVDYARLIGDHEQIIFITHFLGWVLSHQGSHSKAMMYNQEALQSSRQLGDAIWICSALQSFSQVLRRSGKRQKAAAACNEALSLLEAIPEDQRRFVEADINYELGKLARDSKDWEKAQTLFEAAQHVFRVDDEQPIFNIEFAWGLLSNLGEVARHRGDYDTALRYYLQCLETYRKTGGKGDIATLLVRMAALEEQRGDGSAATRYAREAYELASGLGMQWEQQRAAGILRKRQAPADQEGGV